MQDILPVTPDSLESEGLVSTHRVSYEGRDTQMQMGRPGLRSNTELVETA